MTSFAIKKFIILITELAVVELQNFLVPVVEQPTFSYHFHFITLTQFFPFTRNFATIVHFPGICKNMDSPKKKKVI